MIKNYKTYLESVKWYSKGILTPDDSFQEPVEDDQNFRNRDYVYPKIINKVYFWHDDAYGAGSSSIKNAGKWTLANFSRTDLPCRVINTDYCEDIEGYTGQIIQLKGKWPWFKSNEFQRYSPMEKNEGVKWYSKGKLIPDDSFKDDIEDNTVFEVGDRLYVEYPDYYSYWFDSTNQDEDRTSVYNKGNWNSINNKIKQDIKVVKISYCENIDGYTGQIIQLDQGYWPWFQITNFKKK